MVESSRETRVRDGRAWPIGREREIAWIMDGTDDGGVKVTCAIPPLFAAYWTLELPYSGDDDWDQNEVDQFPSDVIDVLAADTSEQPWWLGFLQRGDHSDIIFPDAHRVVIYNGGYVLVQAGPRQAGIWRNTKDHSPPERLPDVMFPENRLWLASNLWDDDWTYFGGPAKIQRGFLEHPRLRHRVRAVGVDDPDATPPGHIAI